MTLLITVNGIQQKMPSRGTSSPIAEPSENTLAAAEVAAGCLLFEAGLMMLMYSLAPGTY